MSRNSKFKMGPYGVRERKIDLGISGRQTKSQFVGPVPLEWARRSWTVPGKAAVVGQAICYRSGVKESATVVLPYSELAEAGIPARTVRRALEALEAAGLVSVTRQRGRSPVVTILEVGEP